MDTDHNIFLSAGTPELSAGHPANTRLRTRVAALACDRLDEAGPLKVPRLAAFCKPNCGNPRTATTKIGTTKKASSLKNYNTMKIECLGC